MNNINTIDWLAASIVGGMSILSLWSIWHSIRIAYRLHHKQVALDGILKDLEHLRARIERSSDGCSKSNIGSR